MNLKSRLLRVLYNGMLTGMPTIMNNPYNKNPLYAPFKVDKSSLYINYRLTSEQYSTINQYLNNSKSRLKIAKTAILKDDNRYFFLSINIYNCTSPLFSMLTKDYVTRCEINTYVIDNLNNIGTLIIDYGTSQLSLDSYNLIKMPDKFIDYKKDNNNNKLYGYVKQKNIDFNFTIKLNEKLYSDRLSHDLIKYTDRIYYLDGIYDKLYYDTSLLNNPIVIINNNNNNNNNIEFNFLGSKFYNPDSVFVFSEPINFVGSMWENLFNSE